MLLLISCGQTQESWVIEERWQIIDDYTDTLESSAWDARDTVSQINIQQAERGNILDENLIENTWERANLETYIWHPEIKWLELTWYVSILQREEMFCFENCEKYTYVFFHILSHDDDIIDDFLKEQQGNSFVSENAIGLWCLNDGITSRMNISDQFGMKEYIDTSITSETLINSSEHKPVTITINKYLFTKWGSGAPSCYSHFADIEFVK